jgi:hypothetical protein
VGETGRTPHRIVDAEPDEPAEQQIELVSRIKDSLKIHDLTPGGE